MLKLLLIHVLLLFALSRLHAQSTILTNRLIIREFFSLNGTWIKGISSDSTMAPFSSAILTTQEGVHKFVTSFVRNYNDTILGKGYTAGIYIYPSRNSIGNAGASPLSVRSVSLGDGAAAMGNSVALGYKATTETGSVAIGHQAKGAASSVAIGNTTNATLSFSTAIGDRANAGGMAVVIGNSAKAGATAVGIGGDAEATGTSAIGVGNRAKALHVNSIAIGFGASATDTAGIAVGNGTYTSTRYATAMGSNAQAAGNAALALGRSSRSIADSATAIGNFAYAVGKSSLALGRQAYAYANGSWAIMDGSGNRNENQYIDSSDIPNSLFARFKGGYQFYTDGNWGIYQYSGLKGRTLFEVDTTGRAYFDGPVTGHAATQPNQFITLEQANARYQTAAGHPIQHLDTAVCQRANGAGYIINENPVGKYLKLDTPENMVDGKLTTIFSHGQGALLFAYSEGVPITYSGSFTPIRSIELMGNYTLVLLYSGTTNRFYVTFFTGTAYFHPTYTGPCKSPQPHE